MSVSEQLGNISLSVFLAVVIVVFSLLVALVWRIIRRRPLFSLSERTKLDSPGILYVGICLFGLFGLAAFMKGMIVYAVLFLMFMLGFVAALVAFRRGWRG